MINRVELKEKGKRAFLANYWKCVIVSVILLMISGTTIGASSRVTYNAAGSSSPAAEVSVENATETITNTLETNPVIVWAVVGVVLVVALIAIAISTAIDIFLINPIEIGCKSFFLKNAGDPSAEIDEIKKGFTPNYSRNIKAMFLKGLYTFLWGLLFVIPGIMKKYSYRLVPFILAEDDLIEPKDAIRKSMDMMKGHRWEAFVLDLSFLGWIILSVLTLGLLLIFYVHPYMSGTDVEFYKKVKELYQEKTEEW